MMKKNFIYVLIVCFILLLVVCSMDLEDVISKYVYGENENFYLKMNVDVVVFIKVEFFISCLEVKMVKLIDYVEKFYMYLGMMVDEMLVVLFNGSVVFYFINILKNCWNRIVFIKGINGWYYNMVGGVCDVVFGIVSIELDVIKKELVFNVFEIVFVGIVIFINVGFVINNGVNFDDYVCFVFDVIVIDLGCIVVVNIILVGDYFVFFIEFVDYQEVIESCLGLILFEFIIVCKELGGLIVLYMVDSEFGEWNIISDYIVGGSGIGYWLIFNLKVMNWSDDGLIGSVLFVEI